MQTSGEIYQPRKGTKDEGKDYEFEMTSLLALRCVQHAENVSIAANAEGVGDFDDIILKLTVNGERFDILLQLKHKGNANPLTPHELLGRDRKLPLKKYCEDIATLAAQETTDQNENIFNKLGSFNNIYCVLFTNRGMDLKKFEENQFVFYEIDKCDGKTSFLKSLLNTYNGNDDCVFKFDLQNIPEDISTEDGRIFANFRLFTNQICRKVLHQEIVSEITKVAPFKLKKDEKEIAEQFNKYIKKWANGELGSYHCLTKEEILFKLAELYLNQYEVNLRLKPFKGYASSRENIFNKLVSGKTITIIDSNETVSQHMVQFISNEVEKYCKGFNKNWSDNLSSTERQSFCSAHDHLKQTMLKIVGKNQKVGLTDVYKCLWRAKEVPLLLHIDDVEEYHNILNILQLTNFSHSVIILNGTGRQLPKKENVPTFHTLQDLGQQEQNMILKQSVKLQGRNLLELGSLLGDTMFENIKSSDIISILAGTFSIGEEIKHLPRYFIHRNITKIFIKSNVFQSHFLGDEKIFWEHPKRDDLDRLVPDSSVIFTNPEEIEKWKPSYNIHCCCGSDDDLLEWKWTLGSTRTIRNSKDTWKVAYETNISYYFSNHTNIISEVPGMGKSILMDYVAREAPTTKWVLRVDLNQHLRYYRKNINCKNRNTDAVKHLQFFFNQEKNILAKKIFDKLLKEKNVIILLDGFDEISISYGEEVTNIAMSLQKGGYHVWLTTRPHMQEHLEKKFNTFAISLQPFTEENKKKFLVDYFSDKIKTGGCEERLNKFVEGLLEATKKNLHDYDAKFTGIPLQTELLADYFIDKCEDCLSHGGRIVFNEKFDLLDLYESFIQKKLDKLEEKYEESALEETEKCRKDQPILALQLVFRLEDFEEVDDIKKVNDYYTRKNDKKQHLQRDGVITIDKEGNLNCTHRTFAEFLVAQFLADNLRTENEHLQQLIHDLTKQRFSKNYQFLFNIFDRIVARDCDLHMAVINEQLNESMEIDLKSFSKRDAADRTVLHMLALYDDETPLSDNRNSKMLKIIDKIPKSQFSKLCGERDVFGFTPLDYALANDSSLILADALCASQNLAPIKACINVDYFLQYMTKSDDLRLHKLSGLLLPYFVTRDLLQDEAPKDMNIKLYLKNLKSFDRKSEHLYGVVDKGLLGFLQIKGKAYSGFDNNYYADLRFAVRYGTMQNVQEVAAKSEKIDRKDVDNNTPLHYAVLSQNLDMIDILLKSGANTNKRNLNCQTPLHFGFGTKNVKVINLLLTKDPNFDIVDKKGWNSLHYAVSFSDLDVVKQLIGKVDINKQDNDGHTPLHLALQNCKWEIADWLLNNGADVNVVNNKNQNALHYVILFDREYMIKSRSFTGMDKNVQDLDGNTPLHLELRESSPHPKTVHFLVKNGADVNIQNHIKETPLHVVFNNKISQNSTIVELLLDHGADVNLQNNFGDNAIHCAIDCGNINVVRMMLPKLQNSNEQNCHGNTYLHLAAKNGLSDIIQGLISQKVNFNKVNNYQETPLHFAAESNSAKTVSVLLDNGVSKDRKDKHGNTALHVAVTNDNVEIAKLLVAKGANVDIPNNRHKSSLDLARKNAELFALLSQYSKNGPQNTFHKNNSNFRRRVR